MPITSHQYLHIHTHTHTHIHTMKQTMNEDMELLKRNSKDYQTHRSTANRIGKALQHQNNIKLFQSIPKRYQPPAIPELVVPNSDISKKFTAQYEKLFFQCLDEAITHNTISLELENARLKEIVTRTEKQLSTIRNHQPTPTEILQG